jgi:hypothetical protein
MKKAGPHGRTVKQFSANSADSPVEHLFQYRRYRKFPCDFNRRSLPRTPLEMRQSSHALPKIDGEQLATKHSTRKRDRRRQLIRCRRGHVQPYRSREGPQSYSPHWGRTLLGQKPPAWLWTAEETTAVRPMTAEQAATLKRLAESAYELKAFSRTSHCVSLC